jgi:hypothetical protein
MVIIGVQIAQNIRLKWKLISLANKVALPRDAERLILVLGMWSEMYHRLEHPLCYIYRSGYML